MRDLTILHLSDLHISWNGNKTQYPVLHQNMVSDIKKQSEYFENNVIVVVTGDIVQKGEYTEQTIGAVISFFQDLRLAILGESRDSGENEEDSIKSQKFVDIFIVPGNHDKKRTNLQENIADLIAGKSTPLPGIYDDLLHENCLSFSDYSQLVAQIYNVFDVKDRHINTIAHTYGANMVEIDYGREGKLRYLFISLNTALNCVGDSDQRNLRLGQKQIDKIQQEINNMPIPYADLTFVLAHHPPQWLVGSEEDSLQNRMLSPAYWKSSLYLCGHVHQRDAISWHNTHHSLTTLMTGFGWPDSGNVHSDIHLYSVYVINLDFNSVDIYVRSTNDGGVFVPDFRFYGERVGDSRSKISYPLERTKTHPYIELSRADDRSSRTVYLNDEFVKLYQYFGRYLCLFQNTVTTFIWMFHRMYNSGELSQPSDTPLQITDVEKSEERAQKLLYESFTGFLQAICYQLIDCLPNIIPNTDNAVKNASIRCHARYYREDGDKYCQICSSYGSSEENPSEIQRAPESFRSPKDVNWDSLIKKAFEKEAPFTL